MEGVSEAPADSRAQGAEGPVPRAVVEILHCCVRAALHHASDGSPGWRWTTDHRRAEVEARPAEFLRAVAGHKVAGLLAPHAEMIGLPDQLAGPVQMYARRVIGRSLAQVGLMQEVHSRLQAAGIPVLFLKGLAVEAQTGRELGDRGAGDLDVWVPTECVSEAIAVLRQPWTVRVGYPQPGPSWAWRHWLRWGREISLDGPVVIDLHWGLSGFSSYLPDFGSAWADRQMVVVGVHRFPTLSFEHALAHACRHAELDRWRFLRNLVDVSMLADHVEPVVRPGWARTLEVANRAVGLPAGWNLPVANARLWAEVREEHRYLGPHRSRTSALSRAAYLRRVLRTVVGPDPARDAMRLWWLLAVPPPHRLGSITTSSAVRGVAQGMTSRLRFELSRAIVRRSSGRAAGDDTDL